MSHFALCALCALALIVGCSAGENANQTKALPVDVVYPFDRDPDWTAWSYEPGLVATAEDIGGLPSIFRPDETPSPSGLGVMLSSSPYVGMDTGYVDANRRSYEGRKATASDIGLGLLVSRRKDAMIETLLSPDGSKTTVTGWAKPGLPAWSKVFSPAPQGTGAALSPDGTLAALVQITPDGMVELSLHDVATGAQRWAVRTGGPAGAGTYRVDYPVAFSQEGDRILFARFSQGKSLAQIRKLDGTLITDVRASLPGDANEDLGFTYGLASNCLWISRIYYSERSDSNTHGTNSWNCELEVIDVRRDRQVADSSFRPRGDAFHRRVFDSDPRADDCPARLVVADGAGLSVVSYQAGTPGHVRVRTFPTIPGCK